MFFSASPATNQVEKANHLSAAGAPGKRVREVAGAHHALAEVLQLQRVHKLPSVGAKSGAGFVNSGAMRVL